mgnify:CR=1 FL=1
MKNRFLFLGIFCFVIGSMNSQVRFGINDTINPSAVVQIDTGDGIRKGLLMPRLRLKSTMDFSPLGEHVAGMVVYNTVQAGLAPNIVYPGYYYNDGTRWNRILSELEVKNIWLNETNGEGASNASQNVYRTGAMGIGTATPHVKLEVNGAIKVGNETNTTTAPSEGMIRFHKTTSKFPGYNGTTWLDLHYFKN